MVAQKQLEGKVGRMKKRIGMTVFFCCLAIGVLTACSSYKTVEIQQPAWHLLSAETTAEGIEVEIAGENLLLKEGVRITADSQENENFPAKLVADGITDEKDLRWSSENDWEDNEHWLQVEFEQETQIGYVKIFWERTNACDYALEYSTDAKTWNDIEVFQSAPETAEQNICLATPVTARYLRLHVTDVMKEEADLSLYYQNVSVLEVEVYEEIQDRFVIETPKIQAGNDRKLDLPMVPEEYEITLGGADYENLLTTEGRIADTLSEVTAEVGFILTREDVNWELPGMKVMIPASQSWNMASKVDLPVAVMEWKAAGGVWKYSENILLDVSDKEHKVLMDVAALFGKELEETNLFSEVTVSWENQDNAKNPAVVLMLSDGTENWLGEEGYEIRVEENRITIIGNTVQGVRWGCVTLVDWLELSSEDDPVLATGTIRDYPKYEVRGFGIDVGRRAISLDLLYRIVVEMSAQKMNTLQIHLNDNQIIAQSEYDGTVEGARNLYAGFRLESSIENENGESITSQDLFYTKEEFKQLIETAAVYGVEIVPEIDTPAHSLALTKVFPELGFSDNPESVEQLDLSKSETRQLVKDIWSEYLIADENSESTFENCTSLHLGMDEYYGKDTTYVEYLQELSMYVEELAPEKELRIWGSLSNVDADYSGVSRKLQMHVWDVNWADPQDMYEEGFPIINSLSSNLYIIPGGGYDELDTEFLDEQWQPNLFITAERSWELPAWSDRMLGACYMMWNDWAWMNGNEITEDSLFERFEKPLPILSEKLWGGPEKRIKEDSIN